MNKNNPRFLVLVSVVATVIATIFYILVFSNIISWKNPFINKENSNNTITFLKLTPTPTDKITPTPYYSSEDVRITELKTDKAEYGSRETVIFTLYIDSKIDIRITEIKISGIKPSNIAYINETETRYIKKGENEIVIEVKTPSCTSGCGGVNPGSYTITAEMSADNKILSVAETRLNLVSK